MLYSIVGILVVIIDQAVKFWVQNTLFGTDIVKFIPGVISLVNVHNSGAAFGILSGSNARIYFIIVTGIFALLVVLALATNFVTGRLARWSLVMVAAGGIGNMIDRIIYGYVQDMFKVELFNFAIFNVADIFITVFAILFAIAMIFEKPEDDIIDELYEDDVEDEEYDDYEKSARKPLMGKMKEKRAAAKSASKKARQEKYEREYEEYRAQQLQAMNMSSTPKMNIPEVKAERAQQPGRKTRKPQVQEAAPAFEKPVRKPQPKNNADLEEAFAAWENASAQNERSRKASYAEEAMGTTQRPVQRRPVQQPRAEAPTVKPEIQMPAVERPAAAAKPAEAVVQPKPAAKSEDFSLDDILAEFK